MPMETVYEALLKAGMLDEEQKKKKEGEIHAMSYQEKAYNSSYPRQPD